MESPDYLPGYFRAELEPTAASKVSGQDSPKHSHPVCALLQVFEDNIHLAERMADFSGLLADPFGVAEFPAIVGSPRPLAVPDTGDWPSRQLSWLASWLALDLDPEWLRDLPQPAGAETNSHPAGRFAKAREVIETIAPLYSERGTPEGLRKMIKLFFDVEVEIHEHSSIRSMEIGVRSTIGDDIWLTETPDLELDFVVLVHSFPPAAKAGIPCLLVSGSQNTPVVCFGGARPPGEATDPVLSGEQEAFVVKLGELIEREKPAHTRGFLAFADASAPKPKPLETPPMVIEESSIIEDFFIN